MKAPAFKPIYDLTRIKKKEEVKSNTPLYKEFVNLRKQDIYTETKKDIHIIIYEHKEYGTEDNSTSSQRGNSDEGSDNKSNENSDVNDSQNNDDVSDDFCVTNDKKNKKKCLEIKQQTEKKKKEEIEKEKEKKKENTDDNKKEKNSEKQKNKKGKEKFQNNDNNNNNTLLKEQQNINTKIKNTNNKSEDKKILEHEKEQEQEQEQEQEKEKEKEKKRKKHQDCEIVKENKKKRVLGTLKILYNFYVNLFDKIKEDVENIKNKTNNNKVNLFRDVNLYTNYISMFDIINLCEDFKIIKNFIHSKKECEIIWILTVNYFDKMQINIFEKYKSKIDMQSLKNEMKNFENNKQEKQEKQEKQNKQETTRSSIKDNYQQNEIEKDKDKDKDKEEKNNKSKKDKGKTDKNKNKKEKDKDKEIEIEKEKEKEEEGDYTPLKEYIYENCSEKENALYFRKINFFIFIYIIIYLIKISSYKIKSITDDLKKVKSFFFYLNIYEIKKTMETLTHLYKDKYLYHYQNFNGAKEIEEYRKRKIFCHKFSFQHIYKIINKSKDITDVKNRSTENKHEVLFRDKREVQDNTADSYLLQNKESTQNEKKRTNENKTPNWNNTIPLSEQDTNINVNINVDVDSSANKNVYNKKKEEKKKEKEKLTEKLTEKEKVTEDINEYEKTTYIDENILNINKNEDILKNGNDNFFLNQHIFDFIFKNYCYKTDYWKMSEGNYIDFGIIQKKEKNKIFKIDIYNYSKYNINVDIEIDSSLPLIATFKNKLFCVNSKYSVYIKIDKTKIGEQMGFMHILFFYKNINKQCKIKIPVYIFVES